MQGWGLPAFGFPAFRIVPGTPSPIQTHRETSHIRLVALLLARSSRSLRPLRGRHGPYARIWDRDSICRGASKSGQVVRDQKRNSAEEGLTGQKAVRESGGGIDKIGLCGSAT